MGERQANQDPFWMVTVTSLLFGTIYIVYLLESELLFSSGSMFSVVFDWPSFVYLAVTQALCGCGGLHTHMCL